MSTAEFVSEIQINDPDTGLPVCLSVYKHSNGGMFAIDSSYLDQVLPEGEQVEINDPLSDEPSVVTLID